MALNGIGTSPHWISVRLLLDVPATLHEAILICQLSVQVDPDSRQHVTHLDGRLILFLTAKGLFANAIIWPARTWASSVEGSGRPNGSEWRWLG